MKERFGTLREFQELVTSLPAQCLFRGQSNARFKLIPGVGRSHPQYVSTAHFEHAIYQQFKNRSHPYVGSIKLSNEWDWLVTAQHHGLKTRLLDWTTDWRVALYFAALPHDEMRKVAFSVFIFPRPNLTAYQALPANPFSCSKDYYFQPPHLNNRIIAQAAYLSLHADPYNPLDDKNIVQFSFYPFQEHRQQIAQFLANSRITAAEMNPGLDGICKTLCDEPRIAAQVELEMPETDMRAIGDLFLPSRLAKPAWKSERNFILVENSRSSLNI